MNLTRAKAAIEGDGFVPYQEGTSFLGAERPSGCRMNCTTFTVDASGAGATVYIEFPNPDSDQSYASLEDARARGDVLCNADIPAFNQTLAAFEGRSQYTHAAVAPCLPLLVTPP